MSFLSNRYLKEGPGVYADDPPKSPPALFFSILFRKFWTIGSVNLMYVLFSLPVLAALFFLSPFLLSNLFPGLTTDAVQQYLVASGFTSNLGTSLSIQDYTGMVLLTIFMVSTVFFTGMSLIVSGPIHAGMTYILRNFSREKHAFVWSDFKEHAKNNWKQATASSLLSLAATVVLIVGLGVYRTIIESGFLRGLMTMVFILFFLIFAVMQMYVYPMMVTFQLKLKHIYKNAFLFFSLKLFYNIGILLICIVHTLLLPVLLMLFLNQLGMLIYVVYFATFGFGFQFLLVNFFVYRQLDKHMIRQVGVKDADEEGETDEEETDEDEYEEAVEKIPPIE